MTSYSNPRMQATIENWPHGSQRVTAIFTIEADKRGERAIRVTNHEVVHDGNARYPEMLKLFA